MSMKSNTLGDIAEILQTGKTPPSKRSEYFGGDIQWFTPGDFNGKYLTKSGRTVTQLAIDENKAKLVPKNTVLITCIGNIGNAGIVKQPSASNQQITAIKPKENLLLPGYLYYWIRYNQPLLEHRANKAVVPILNNRTLKKIKIEIPSLEVQQKIVEILDEASKLYGFQKNRYKKIEELRDSIFYKMFGNPITNDKKWKLLSGKEYAEDISVGVVVKPASYYVEAGIPALRSQNINPMQIDTSNMVYFSEIDSDNKLSKSKLYYRDVVLVRTGLPGTAAVVPKDMDGINCIDIVIVRPRAKILNPTYFAAFMNSSGGKDMVLKNKRGQIQKHLNVGALQKTKIPVPDIELQDEFESILDYLALTQEEMLKATRISEKVFSSLLQKAFNGDLL